jgi:hypothetical protein
MRRFLALFCLATMGCAASPRHLTLDLPRTEVAEVRGLDESSGSFGLPPPECHVRFQTIDGESVEDRFDDGLPRIIDLRPGEHVLGCWYQVMPLSGPSKEGTCDIPISAQAGHVYQLRMDWGFVTIVTGHTFTVEICDITQDVKRMEHEEAARRSAAAGKLEPY